MSPPSYDDWVYELATWLNDENRLPVHAELSETATSNSDDWFHCFSLSSLMQAARNQPQRHQGRTVWQAHYQPEPGIPQTVFIKAQWEWSYRPPKLSRIICRDWRQPSPVRERLGIEQAAKLGLNVPEILFHERRHPFSAEAVLVTKAIPVSQPVSELALSHQLDAMSKHQQHSLMQTIGETLGTIHREGWVWRGVNAKHLFPEWCEASQTWKLWLIDCEGFHRQLTGQHQTRDTQKLWESCRAAGINDDGIQLAQASYQSQLQQSQSSTSKNSEPGFLDDFKPIAFPASSISSLPKQRKAA